MAKEHTYSNGEVTIVWKPSLCIHSTKCWKGLRTVFRPGERPWIHPQDAPTDRIVEQVQQCPSGALGYRMDDGSGEERAVVADPSPTEVEVSGNGPLLVMGTCVVKHADGRTEIREKATAFCRCGGSANKPYCDGSHRANGSAG